MTRSQSERDRVTVEICYALLSAGVSAVLVFGAIAGPVAVWDLPSGVERTLLLAGGFVAAALAVVRVVHVLRRFSRNLRG
ncbi:DUF6332 family protein [Streptomyces sp. TS71-3]|uniref:DUF6332 family protein n=1 Tax=Streptomyces sp. TS71-3 TaxID=2733862 RepID=UPI001B2A9F04|nr:DUF6332 family protein [Streptomyces sp. TS71-3]GHJ39381.1 hypothetical protein Sm713_49900 [Streptomyces sp. TS71-3]